MTQREKMQKTIINTRANLLLLCVITLINVVMLLLNSGVFLLFSASFPWFIIGFCQGISEEIGNNIATIIGIALSLLSIGFYFLCYILSKKNPLVWYILALVAFVIDCVCLLWVFATIGFDTSYLLDIGFHIWILYYLISGVNAALKINKLPIEEITEIDVIEQPQIEATSEIIEEVDVEQTPTTFE